MIALPEPKRLICPSCGSSAIGHAEQSARLLEKHRQLNHADAARRAEGHMLHYWQAAIDYVAHDPPYRNRLAGALRTYQRRGEIPDFKALRWDMPQRGIVRPGKLRSVNRIDNKAWIKNGKVLMRNGKVLLCDECPCGPQTAECEACLNGEAPRFLEFTIGTITDGTFGPCCMKSVMSGRTVLCEYSHTITNEFVTSCQYTPVENIAQELADACGGTAVSYNVGGGITYVHTPNRTDVGFSLEPISSPFFNPSLYIHRPSNGSGKRDCMAISGLTLPRDETTTNPCVLPSSMTVSAV